MTANAYRKYCKPTQGKGSENALYGTREDADPCEEISSGLVVWDRDPDRGNTGN